MSVRSKKGKPKRKQGRSQEERKRVSGERKPLGSGEKGREEGDADRRRDGRPGRAGRGYRGGELGAPGGGPRKPGGKRGSFRRTSCDSTPPARCGARVAAAAPGRRRQRAPPIHTQSSGR